LPSTLSNNVLKLSHNRKFHGCRQANSLHRNCDGHCHIVWGIFYIHGVPELAPLLSSSGDYTSYRWPFAIVYIFKMSGNAWDQTQTLANNKPVSSNFKILVVFKEISMSINTANNLKMTAEPPPQTSCISKISDSGQSPV
jgi:hypothetical protein